MILRNLSFIKTSKLKKAISLLDIQYRDMDIIIYIYENKWFYCLHNIFDFIFAPFYLLNSIKNYRGWFHRGRKFDNIVVFRQEYIILTLNTLFHEIRHAYQYHYTNMFDRRYIQYSDIDDNYNEYKRQSVERDADNFSIDFISKNRKQIKKIFNIKFTGIRINSNNSKCLIRKYNEL